MRALFDRRSRAATLSAVLRIAWEQCGKPAKCLGLEAGGSLGGDQGFEFAQFLGHDLGQYRLQDPAVEHDRDGGRRVVHAEELDQFVGDALARQGHEVVGARGAGIERRGVGLAAAEAGVEAEEAQDSEMVFGDALQRIADEADVAALEVVEAAEIVEDFAGHGVGRQRIDGEIAARGVFFPIVGEGDGGAAAVGADVAAEGGDLERMAVADGGDGAMLDSGRHRLDPRRFQPRHDFVGFEPCREVEVTQRQSHEQESRTAPPT